jgi:cell division septation protein DedD
MDSETPYLKWTAAAIGFIIVCFSVGFFVLGPKGASQQANNGVGGATANASNTPLVPKTTPAPDLNIVETTTAREATAIRIKDLEAEVEKLKADNTDLTKQLRAKAQVESDAAAARAQATREASTHIERPHLPSESATPEPEATPRGNENSNTTSDTPPSDANKENKSDKNDKKLYRVLVGPFDSRDEANTKSDEMKSRGYAALVRKDLNSGRYYVQNGVFSKQNAEERQKELKNNGYDADIIGD